MYKSIISSILSVSILTSCLSSESESESKEETLVTGSSFIDERDGTSYKVVVINSQIWMAENLNFGDLTNALNNQQLQKNNFKYCLDNKYENCTSYGGLYQWHTMMNLDSSCVNSTCEDVSTDIKHQGICPIDWHIPQQEEWDELTLFLGGEELAGGALREKNSDSSSWVSDVKYEGTLTEFNGLASGYRNDDGSFYGERFYTEFWEASSKDSTHTYSRGIDVNNNKLERKQFSKFNSFSVRCLKN